MPAAPPTVVVIDDEENIRTYLAEVLSLDGYRCKSFEESPAALAYLSRASPLPDLVMTDIRMPGMDGLELLKRVQALSPGLPVILISGIYDLAIALEALRAGAADYLFKPAKPAEVLSLVAKHVRPGQEARQAAVYSALQSFLATYKSQHDRSPSSNGFSAHLAQLFETLGFKRYETMQHSMRVAGYSALLGKACSLPRGELQNLEVGAMLHDIGKIGIPLNILLKPGPLTEKEWEVIRTHPSIGFQLVAEWPGMEEAALVVHAHHERYDGKGYPLGLERAEIPTGARVFSIVDAVDAITSDRPYRPAQGFDAAFRELRAGSGTQFDPSLTSTFLRLPGAELHGIRNRFPDE